ncbi:MAG: metallophosphoesterase [Candidatus Cryptobacteroides sp.]
MSDLHLRSFNGRRRALQRAVDNIKALEPDMIIFSGDIVTLSADEIPPMMDILSQLQAPDGIFSVMGNHDYLGYARELTPQMRVEGIAALKEAQADMGWQMLDNQCVNLSRGADYRLSVIGIENLSVQGHFQSYGDISKASEGARGQFKILISHDPSAWEKHVVGKTDIDLTLSGHTHDMQFALFGLSPSALVYRHHRGLYSSDDSVLDTSDTRPVSARTQYLYVNIGLGETIFPARIGAPGEITLITLKSQNPGSCVRQ